MAVNLRRISRSHLSKLPASVDSFRFVPETKVKDLLRDIAFVLNATSRLSSEIRAAETYAKLVETSVETSHNDDATQQYFIKLLPEESPRATAGLV